MTVPTWTAKANDRFRAPQAIHLQIDGEDVDLTGPDWTVTSQARLDPSNIDPAIEFEFDQEQLALSKIVLLADPLPDTPGDYEIDIEAENPTPEIRQSSQTFTLRIEADVTRPVPAP